MYLHEEQQKNDQTGEEEEEMTRALSKYAYLVLVFSVSFLSLFLFLCFVVLHLLFHIFGLMVCVRWSIHTTSRASNLALKHTLQRSNHILCSVSRLIDVKHCNREKLIATRSKETVFFYFFLSSRKKVNFGWWHFGLIQESRMFTFCTKNRWTDKVLFTRKEENKIPRTFFLQKMRKNRV